MWYRIAWEFGDDAGYRERNVMVLGFRLSLALLMALNLDVMLVFASVPTSDVIMAVMQ